MKHINTDLIKEAIDSQLEYFDSHGIIYHIYQNHRVAYDNELRDFDSGNADPQVLMHSEIAKEIKEIIGDYIGEIKTINIRKNMSVNKLWKKNC